MCHAKHTTAAWARNMAPQAPKSSDISSVHMIYLETFYVEITKFYIVCMYVCTIVLYVSIKNWVSPSKSSEMQ